MFQSKSGHVSFFLTASRCSSARAQNPKLVGPAVSDMVSGSLDGKKQAAIYCNCVWDGPRARKHGRICLLLATTEGLSASLKSLGSDFLAGSLFEHTGLLQDCGADLLQPSSSSKGFHLASQTTPPTPPLPRAPTKDRSLPTSCVSRQHLDFENRTL